jgi:hypothetical protein
MLLNPYPSQLINRSADSILLQRPISRACRALHPCPMFLNYVCFDTSGHHSVTIEKICWTVVHVQKKYFISFSFLSSTYLQSLLFPISHISSKTPFFLLYRGPKHLRQQRNYVQERGKPKPYPTSPKFPPVAGHP